MGDREAAWRLDPGIEVAVGRIRLSQRSHIFYSSKAERLSALSLTVPLLLIRILGLLQLIL
jgi:hypothetical protein